MGIFPISTFHCVWWHCGITVVLLIFTTSDPNICVCVRACTALKVCTMKCRFFVSACNCESLCCLQAPLHLIVAGSAECIYSLFSLSVSVPLSSCVLYPPRTIFLHHPCASTGMCLRAWATSGHSLSTSATCLMTQPTSAWLGRRRASRRFLSKVYESLSLEESFFQEGEGFFFFFCPVWRTLSFERWEAWQLCSFLVFVSVICLFRCFLCHTAARCSPLSAQSFLMDTWRVRLFLCFVYCHVSLLSRCTY